MDLQTYNQDGDSCSTQLHLLQKKIILKTHKESVMDGCCLSDASRSATFKLCRRQNGRYWCCEVTVYISSHRHRNDNIFTSSGAQMFSELFWFKSGEDTSKRPRASALSSTNDKHIVNMSKCQRPESQQQFPRPTFFSSHDLFQVALRRWWLW